MVLKVKSKGVVLVTGAAQRIGKAISLELVRSGYDIALHCNQSKAQAEKTAREIKALGRRCEIFACDLSDKAEASLLVDNVLQKFRRFNVLVNNASVFESSSVHEEGIAALKCHLSVNFRAPYILMNCFARKVRKGNIINILDANRARPGTGFEEYALSKRMLAEWTALAALKFAPAIRVNAVAPGLILPPVSKGKDYLDRLSRRIPLKRRGKPSHVTHAVRFLLENDYVTGQVIFEDGGAHLI